MGSITGGNPYRNVSVGVRLAQLPQGTTSLHLRFFKLGAALSLAAALATFAGTHAARAQALSYADPAAPLSSQGDEALYPQRADDDTASSSALPERLRRTIVSYATREAPGTIIIDTRNTQLYYVLGDGRAIRYGVGVGREGFTWSGVQTVARKAEWPDWTPPPEMIARQPYLPRFMAGGPGNPLGARAMYLGASTYRIHGTNDPTTIGKFVSSGCIRLTNEDVSDLFSRVKVGAKVIVLPKSGSPQFEAKSQAPAHRLITSAAEVRPASTSVTRVN